MPQNDLPPFTGPALCALEAHEIVNLLRRREVSPEDLIAAALARIEAVEPHVNAMPTLCAKRARAAVSQVAGAPQDHPGWLGGLPLGIKDLDRVAGVRTTFGTLGLADHVPEVSDHFVDRLEALGGIVIGKTNTPELGAGANTFNGVFGATRNPWNIALNAAGSSGGAAAALATGETWLSQGSDHGGSLRTPAAYCGVVGLRPAPGRVAPRLIPGASAGFITEGVIGPMGRSVRDVALFLDAMVGFEPALPYSLPAPATPFQAAVDRARPAVRLAYAPDLGGFGAVEPVIRAAMDGAMTAMEAEGAVVEATCPDLTGLETTYRCLRGMGLLAGPARMPAALQDHFKPSLKANIAQARALTSDEMSEAQVDRTRLFLAMEAFLRDFDVLACATVGAMPRAVELEWIDEIEGQRYSDYIGWLRFAYLATTTGLPAISLPIGRTPDNLPIGLQLIGPPQGEAKLLAVARAIEAVTGGPFRPIDPVQA